MRRPLTLALLLLLAPVVLFGSHAASANPLPFSDPFNAAYAVTEQWGSSSSANFRRYWVFQRNGDQFALATIDSGGLLWAGYALGTISGNSATGTLIRTYFGLTLGTFSVTVSADGTLSGVMEGPTGSLTTVSGTQFFPTPFGPFTQVADDPPANSTYIVNEEWRNGGRGRDYYVFLRVGDQVALVMLDPLGFWSYGLGIGYGNTAIGTWFLSWDNQPVGDFSVTFNGDGTLSGWMTREYPPTPSQWILLSGERLF